MSNDYRAHNLQEFFEGIMGIIARAKAAKVAARVTDPPLGDSELINIIQTQNAIIDDANNKGKLAQSFADLALYSGVPGTPLFPITD